VGWSSLGWLLPLAYLALPNCEFRSGTATSQDPNLIKGPKPWSSAIFCDIEKKSELGGHRRCATATDLQMGTRLEHAAVALTTGPKSNIGLDYRPGAPAESGLTCDPGVPVAIIYEGPFPEGYTGVCLDCTGATPGDVALACVDQCKDLNGGFAGANPPDVVAFCENPMFVHTSTNASTCFDNACTGDTGVLPGDYVDPRRTPEPVDWTDVTAGVKVTGLGDNTLTRETPSGIFNEGAASEQLITQGDGYVEFTATETTAVRSGGLTSGVVPGTSDNDPSEADINFAARLSANGNVRIFESGIEVPGPVAPNNTFGPYETGDRIRVSVTERPDGMADIAYSRREGCTGTSCVVTTFLRFAGPAPYPFRVDASLRDQGATLTDVRIVRIK
jgi:hypothetical protein